MTAISNAEVFGDHRRALSDEQLATLRGYTRGLGSVPIDRVSQFPTGIFPWTIQLGSDPDNTTVDSLPYKIPFPVKCWGIDLGCLTAAGSAATGNILWNPGSGAVSVFTAAKDIKTAAGAFTRYAPEEDFEVWEYNDTVTFRVIGTGAGAVVGARAVLWLQSL